MEPLTYYRAETLFHMAWADASNAVGVANLIAAGERLMEAWANLIGAASRD